MITLVEVNSSDHWDATRSNITSTTKVTINNLFTRGNQGVVIFWFKDSKTLSIIWDVVLIKFLSSREECSLNLSATKCSHASTVTVNLDTGFTTSNSCSRARSSHKNLHGCKIEPLGKSLTEFLCVDRPHIVMVLKLINVRNEC